MKLKDFLEDYKENGGEDDILSIFYTEELPRGKTRRVFLSESQYNEARACEARRSAARLLGKADIINAKIEPTEGIRLSLSGYGGKKYECNAWSAEIDGDQAKIALGVHPLLRAKPSKKARQKR